MRWEIDPNHSTVSVSARHMMIATVRGTMKIRSGWIDFDESDPERGEVEVVAAVLVVALAWGDERIAFSATTTIDRRDWGMVWNAPLETGGVLVGYELKVDVDVEAKAAAAVPAEARTA